ncbi:MAG: hypothetical protein IJS57_05600 [Paludibacteraceae bacterium]|nr:hypothetical protein [Paludibacteraceae bacterium]
MKNFEEINRAQGAKKADNLKELRELRIQEKAIKARIDEISGKATDEAVAILEAQGEIKGEFEVEGVGKFQLQRTEVFDFADYHKYPQEQAVKWRENAKEKVREQNLVKARTAVMNGYMKTFVELYPDKEPDEIKLTVKVVE